MKSLITISMEVGTKQKLLDFTRNNAIKISHFVEKAILKEMDNET